MTSLRRSDSGASITPIGRLRAHPIYPELVARYRKARKAWRYINAQLQDVGLGLSQRGYCDAFIAHNYDPLTWSSNATEYTTDVAALYQQAWLDSMAD